MKRFNVALYIINYILGYNNEDKIILLKLYYYITPDVKCFMKLKRKKGKGKKRKRERERRKRNRKTENLQTEHLLNIKKALYHF